MTHNSDKKFDGPPSERRGAVRHIVVDFVWYKMIDDGTDDFSSLEGLSRMCDISNSGIGIYVTEKLPLGKLIFLEIAASKMRLSIVGKIVNQLETEDGQFRIGVQFKIIPPNDRLTLARLWKSDEQG